MMLESLSAPLEVRGEVTSACNLRCIHCYNASGNPGDNEMSLYVWINVVDQLVKMRVLDIMFEGGEPLLWPHLIPLLRYASEKPIRISISTNGTLVTRELARELRGKVTYVQVSIDGATPETHDKIRGVSGSFARAVDAVRYMVSEGIPVVITMVLMRPNVSQIDEYVRLGLDLGAKACGFIRFHPTGRGQRNRSDLLLGPSELRDAVARILDARSRVNGIELKFEKLSFPFLLLPDFKWNETTLPLTKWVECAENLAILPDGSVTPCPVLRDLVAGNVRVNTLEEIFQNSTVYRSLRQLRLHQSCVSCRFFSGCRSGCRCFALLEYGDLSAPDPGCWVNSFNMNKRCEVIDRRDGDAEPVISRVLHS